MRCNVLPRVDDRYCVNTARGDAPHVSGLTKTIYVNTDIARSKTRTRTHMDGQDVRKEDEEEGENSQEAGEENPKGRKRR